MHGQSLFCLILVFWVTASRVHWLTISIVIKSIEMLSVAELCPAAPGKHIEPEVYPRPDGTVYMCGETDDSPVPDSPGEVQPRPGACSALKEVSGSLSSALKLARVEAEQACYLPLSADGLPVIGEHPSMQGVYLATGHSCWGILNGPATGLAVAEMIVHGKSSVSGIGALSPAARLL